MRWSVMIGWLAGCQATDVAFVCPDGAALCDTMAVIRDARPPAKGVEVKDVLLYQGVEIALVENGAAIVPDVPIVAGRDALFRIGVTKLDGFSVRPLTARVKLFAEDELVGAFQADFTPSDFDPTNLSSSANVLVKGGALLAGEVGFRVELLEQSEDTVGGGPEGDWAFPGPNDSSPILTSDVGASLKIRLIPVKYNADGGSLPDVSDAFVGGMAARVASMYAAPEVEFIVDEPHETDIDLNVGDGWGLLLGEVGSLRVLRKVPPDEYLYGLFSPTNYGGGTAGLSNLGGPQAIDEFSRSSIGLGTFGPVGSADILAHEVGHAHGRAHSPGCGAAGADVDFPYADGSIGRRGYDRVNDLLIENLGEDGTTVMFYDFMTYCSPQWVSDYNYVWYHDKIKLINDYYYKDSGVIVRTRNVPIREIWVRGDGGLAWGQLRHEREMYDGEPEVVVFLDTLGRQAGSTEGHYQPFPHGVPGGVLFIREPGPDVVAVQVGAVRLAVSR